MTVMQQGLLIAGIGMGLVFIVIIFLWGLMALMMRVTSGKQTDTEEKRPESTDEPLMPEMEDLEGPRRAAAAAVAVALASRGTRRQTSVQSEESVDSSLSPWQAAHRARQLEHKNLRG
jgi:Na+-transporting methylmalonyl-CoA/oxaloacetate decarboxylase gamma subunit